MMWLVAVSLLVGVPLLVMFVPGLRFDARGLRRSSRFSVGTPVVYLEATASTRPAAHAVRVRPSERGEFYYCTIANYLRVADVLADGFIIGVGLANDKRLLRVGDAQLRQATLTERFFCSHLFPR